MRRFLFQWLRDYETPPRWMAFAFYSCRRDEHLWIAFPLNLAVYLAFFIQDRWARKAGAMSWIEREIARRNERAALARYNNLPF